MLTAINFYSLHKHNIFYETLLLFVISSSLPYQLEGFHLRVVRDLTEKTKTLPPPSLATVSINTTAEAPKPNGSVSTHWPSQSQHLIQCLPMDSWTKLQMKGW
jgi:hypothetical protein